jgi:Raf kinase inhibitor-like YbhB/YbcL family protein
MVRRTSQTVGGNAVKHAVGSLVLASVLVLSSLCATPAARAADPIVLKSPTLEDNAPLPAKDAGNNKQNPNCVGDNLSPPLAWSDPPEGTKSFALLMFDPEGRGGLGVSHMVTYGIPASVTGFSEGELSKPSDKYVGGKSLMGLATYFGPCTPPGDWHHYTLTLIATDLDPKALQPGMTRDELFAALNGHTKGAAGLILPFRHPS